MEGRNLAGKRKGRRRDALPVNLSFTRPSLLPLLLLSSICSPLVFLPFVLSLCTNYIQPPLRYPFTPRPSGSPRPGASYCLESRASSTKPRRFPAACCSSRRRHDRSTRSHRARCLRGAAPMLPTRSRPRPFCVAGGEGGHGIDTNTTTTKRWRGMNRRIVSDVYSRVLMFLCCN